MNSKERLNKITTLLRQGKRKEALSLLAQLLSEEPENETAWLLLGYSVEDEDKKKYAFERVLKINPDNSRARKQLLKIADGQETKKSKKGATSSRKTLPIVIGVVVVLVCLITAFAAWMYFQYRNGNQPAFSNLPVTSTSRVIFTHTPRPTRTSTLIPSATPTATITPTPSNTPTPLPLPQQTRNDMEIIRGQVVSLRGLPIIEEVSNEIMPLLKLRGLLTSLFITQEYLETLPDEELVLTLLGLIYPDYNLVDATLNSQADSIGGFYQPEINKVNVIGTGFYGVEKLIYAHEYTHALSDQHFKLDNLGVYPECTLSTQQCLAIRALIEGEAETIQWQWFEQHGTLAPQDLLRFTSYHTPLFTEETPPPPYFGMQSVFAYEYGRVFVTYLVDRGGWDLVNKAYTQKLPATTEQILHPEVYLSGDTGVSINDAHLEQHLREDWRLVTRQSLGEWDTFLLLTAGADEEARINGEIGLKAAAGWSGDTYQVVENTVDGRSVLAAHWRMDSSNDLQELWQAINSHLSARFRNAAIDGAINGNCWLYEGQYSCVYQYNRDVLWLLTPDLETLQSVKSAFPQFY